jgi:hypothetical protein
MQINHGRFISKYYLPFLTILAFHPTLRKRCRHYTVEESDACVYAAFSSHITRHDDWPDTEERNLPTAQRWEQ